jgi:hypothetical protein
MKIYVMIFLIILISIISTLSKKTRRSIEKFITQDEEQPLKSINLCGRNIVFPYFSRNNFTASQRSLTDNNMTKTFPDGKCTINTTNGIVDESHSIVHENSLFYNLKNSCLGLRMTTYDIKENGKKVNITFAANTSVDINNLATLILLNPLYVEFSINTERTSSAYRISNDLLQPNDKSWVFSNQNNIKEYTIPFESVSNLDRGSCDKPFNYKEYSPKQTLLGNSDLNNIKLYENNVLSIKAFYLDKMPTSFQNIGRSLNLKYNKEGSINIFEKDYQKYYQDSYSTQLYEFMNTIALMYTNYVYPILTFNFTINVTNVNKQSLANNNLLICKVYMNNNIGKYQYCSSLTDELKGALNNNIFSAIISGVDDNYYQMSIIIGANNQCNLTGRNNLSFRLPYLTDNNNIDITATISPNEKIVLAKWSNINSGNIGKQFVFAKKNECVLNTSYDVCIKNKQDSVVSNSLYDLFTKNTGNSRNPLENIVMNYSTVYVKDIKSCTIGYTNLLTSFSS